MYTQCPHCHTLFEVHAAQITAAMGKIRCSQCEQVFNALSNQPEATDERDTEKIREPALEPNAENMDSSAASIDHPRPEIALPRPTQEPPLPFAVPDDLPEIEPTLTENEKIRKTKRHPIATLFLSLSALALAALATFQAAWINRDLLIQFPRAHAGFEIICAVIPCNMARQRAPEYFQILDREVRAHPTQANALLATLIVVNRAPFAQKLPLIQLDLLSKEEDLIASRRFHSREYRDSDYHAGALMQPDEQIEVRLELTEPVELVSGYRFEFF